ncbi:unnamed protein product [Protopolystoma xenopodis]|uniref:Uncharacterized protein n=1 Tax=Protopolystoma xenopodis TaxID=117903 RepID=A0A3S5A2C0_9PLAT|nr:unnamed protein product [Protopolystoma xenopodis]
MTTQEMPAAPLLLSKAAISPENKIRPDDGERISQMIQDTVQDHLNQQYESQKQQTELTSPVSTMNEGNDNRHKQDQAGGNSDSEGCFFNSRQKGSQTTPPSLGARRQWQSCDRCIEDSVRGNKWRHKMKEMRKMKNMRVPNKAGQKKKAELMAWLGFDSPHSEKNKQAMHKYYQHYRRRLGCGDIMPTPSSKSYRLPYDNYVSTEGFQLPVAPSKSALSTQPQEVTAYCQHLAGWPWSIIGKQMDALDSTLYGDRETKYHSSRHKRPHSHHCHRNRRRFRALSCCNHSSFVPSASLYSCCQSGNEALNGGCDYLCDSKHHGNFCRMADVCNYEKKMAERDACLCKKGASSERYAGVDSGRTGGASSEIVHADTSAFCSSSFDPAYLHSFGAEGVKQQCCPCHSRFTGSYSSSDHLCPSNLTLNQQNSAQLNEFCPYRDQLNSTKNGSSCLSKNSSVALTSTSMLVPVTVAAPGCSSANLITSPLCPSGSDHAVYPQKYCQALNGNGIRWTNTGDQNQVGSMGRQV